MPPRPFPRAPAFAWLAGCAPKPNCSTPPSAPLEPIHVTPTPPSAQRAPRRHSPPRCRPAPAPARASGGPRTTRRLLSSLSPLFALRMCLSFICAALACRSRLSPAERAAARRCPRRHELPPRAAAARRGGGARAGAVFAFRFVPVQKTLAGRRPFVALDPSPSSSCHACAHALPLPSCPFAPFTPLFRCTPLLLTLSPSIEYNPPPQNRTTGAPSPPAERRVGPTPLAVFALDGTLPSFVVLPPPRPRGLTPPSPRAGGFFLRASATATAFLPSLTTTAQHLSPHIYVAQPPTAPAGGGAASTHTQQTHTRRHTYAAHGAVHTYRTAARCALCAALHTLSPLF